LHDNLQIKRSVKKKNQLKGDPRKITQPTL